ncbi:MAG: helix-turn-helix domain-containing protein [Methylocystaceae bacterium]|nr:helix-turn-helix domain-containing protein [Methylocystaceae bacterium]
MMSNDFSNAHEILRTSSKLFYSVPETMELLCVGRTTLHSLTASGRISKTKIGRKTVYSVNSILTYFNSVN